MTHPRTFTASAVATVNGLDVVLILGHDGRAVTDVVAAHAVADRYGRPGRQLHRLIGRLQREVVGDFLTTEERLRLQTDALFAAREALARLMPAPS